MAANPTISQITLPSGSTYDIKDSTARSDIQDLRNSISGGVHYLGTTTTALTDGATTASVTIAGNSHTATVGDMVNYQAKEFVWDGSKWQEMGDLGAFKALAYKDNASGTYTPAGSVSQPTFTGTAGSDTVQIQVPGNIDLSYDQANDASTLVSFTTTKSHHDSVTFRPKGDVSQPTFTGSSFNSTGSFTPSGSVTITKASSGTANYTPAGTVSTPTITVTPSTTTVNSITAVGTLPSWSATVSSENLTFAWDTGTLPTKGSNTTVATGISSATATQPTFTGTGARLEGSFSGTAGTVTVSGTPTGSVSQPTFTGYQMYVGLEWDDVTKEDTVSITPSGTVSKPTFTGTQATITVS